MQHTSSRSSIFMLVASLIAIYVTSQYLRSSLGVIAPDISAELQLDPRQLATLSSVFFICFALTQIPLGIFIDRFGAKTALLCTSLFALGGTVAFALAPNYEWLLVARAFTGIGCSSFFMVPLVIYGNWFSKEKFSTLAGIQLGFGTGGALLSTAPLAMLADAVGWRDTYLIASYALFAILLCVLLFVRDTPKGCEKPASQASFVEMVRGLPAITCAHGFWNIFFLNASAYAIFAAFFALWGGPFLAEVHGMNLTDRGDILLVMAVGQIAGVFIWGPVDRLFGCYKKPAIAGAMIVFILLIGFVLNVNMSLIYLNIWFFVFGFACGFTPLIIAHGKSIFKPEEVGRGMTLLNLGNIGGVAVMQMLVGYILKLERDNGVSYAEAFANSFGVLAILLLFAIIAYCFAPEGHTHDDPNVK